MDLKNLLRDRRVLVVFVLVIAFAILFLFFNIFVVGGDAFVSQVDSLVSPVIGGIACLLLLPLIRAGEQSDISRKVYRWFLAGLCLWFMAEVSWALYVIVFRQEMPYPSVADVFWLVGYLPLFAGFVTRARSYGVPPVKRDRWLLSGVIGVTLLTAFIFVMPPILRDYDPGRLVESLLNIVYPLVDLTLVTLMLVILFTLEKGKFALPWLLITTGFVCQGVSNLIFSYASWNGLYYPDGRATLLSVFIDFLYNLLYLALILAFIMIRKLSSLRTEIRIDSPEMPTASLAPNTSFVMFTDRHNTIMEVSENVFSLLGHDERAKVIGNSLGDVLGIDAQELKAGFARMVERGYISDWQIPIARPNGETVTVWLTAFPTFDMQNAYTGANVVLRAYLDPRFAAPTLSRETVILVQNVLLKAGVLEKEREKATRKTLQDYFTAKMGVLHALVAGESSQRVARAMDATCEGVARQNGWEVQFEDGRIAFGADMDASILERALPRLLEVAFDYSRRILRESQILAEFKKLDQAMALILDLELVESVGLRI